MRTLLRAMLKGKDIALKTKFEKRIMAIKTLPAAKNGRGSSDQDEYTEFSPQQKRVRGAKSHGRSLKSEKRKRSSSRSERKRSSSQVSSSGVSAYDGNEEYKVSQ